MWLVNMNCLGVLGKKLAGVKSGKMIKKWSKKSICLGGLPKGRGLMGRVV